MTEALAQHLGGDRYVFKGFSNKASFIDYVSQPNQQVDCLIIQDEGSLQDTFDQLRKEAVLLPVLVIKSDGDALPLTLNSVPPPSRLFGLYHEALQYIPAENIDQLPTFIENAINKFLKLSSAVLPPDPQTGSDPASVETRKDILSAQQNRLSEKLKERLGYLGVYYKRNPANFLRHMTEPQRNELIQQLKADYRDIVLNYFANDPELNDKIDNFVNTAFFADVSVAQIVALHMELMDDFSKQLKLEGRSDEILLDYRLTLIDAIAHLCEMYRRSIPRES